MLKGKTAVITGSTSGIGLGIARAFAQAGANLMLNGFGDAALITRLGIELSAHDVKVRHHGADMTKPAEVTALINETETHFGAVDILVNNAGIQHVAPVDEFPEDKWSAVQNIILNSSFHATKAALPGMKTRSWGRIINLVSAHGLVASPFKSAYVAAKHGLIGLTKTTAVEVAAHKLPREQVIRDIILAAQPTKRFVEIEEVAALALYLCGDAAKSITGSSIPIDGGWTAR
jgi:3-hydroxybutyrate dehydrogenase